jgi:predicted  nucleic acid-binding Zn-ribbon protein
MTNHPSDLDDWDYLDETEALQARIAELEDALNSMTIERGQAQAERDEILHNKHDRIDALEAEVTRLKTALAEEIEHTRRADRAAIRARPEP